MSQEQVKVSGKVRAGQLKDSEEIVAILNSSASKSSKIRQIYAITQDRSTTANLVGVIYQHVRNVLNTPVKGQ